ncbi:DUF6907 domain-containing protein [Streptomyces sp. t39]|uniref:DUF6907 domain-containing protein n=1 Tax=Streptomyces sp. t39 TaxID=1828156 RepID=UPI0011CDD869|nr:hypothetical protein [Streptomyces sp. t39]TXS42917.1 hypothetical protein EAO77_35420 [Streptomyces sp. t39]
MSARTVTVPTLDIGDVLVPAPAWCAGHDEAPGLLVDLTHRGAEQLLGTNEFTVGMAQFTQHPYSPRDRSTGLFIEPTGDPGTLGPSEADLYAAALVEAAGQVRQMARWLAIIRGPKGGA